MMISDSCWCNHVFGIEHGPFKWRFGIKPRRSMWGYYKGTNDTKLTIAFKIIT